MKSVEAKIRQSSQHTHPDDVCWGIVVHLRQNRIERFSNIVADRIAEVIHLPSKAYLDNIHRKWNWALVGTLFIVGFSSMLVDPNYSALLYIPALVVYWLEYHYGTKPYSSYCDSIRGRIIRENMFSLGVGGNLESDDFEPLSTFRALTKHSYKTSKNIFQTLRRKFNRKEKEFETSY